MDPMKIQQQAAPAEDEPPKRKHGRMVLARAPRGRPLSVLGSKIEDYMETIGARGNPRDFVLFIGNEMLDEWGKYLLRRPGEGQDKMVLLVHKRDLHKVIGDVEAAKFWSRKLRRRTSYGQPKASRAKS